MIQRTLSPYWGGSWALFGLLNLASMATTSCEQDPAFVNRYLDDQLEINNSPAESDAIIPASLDAEAAVPTEPCQLDHLECLAATFGCFPNDVQCLIEATSGNEDMGTLQLHTEIVESAERKKVDILWVIDSSGSMQEEQQFLGTNFLAFIQGLNGSEINYQTAVTSTDVCDDFLPNLLKDRSCPTMPDSSPFHLRGAFQGPTGEQIISPETIDPIGTFLNYANVGTQGSGFEHGLWAAKLALERTNNGQNDQLMRGGSHLSIIVVSDEEDDGIGLSMPDAYSGTNFTALGATTFRWDHEDMIQHLADLKGDGNFSISAITGTRESTGNLCWSSHSQPREEGTQYIAAARATGGIIQSICQEDWEDGLYKLGQDVVAQISQIELTSEPVKGTIQVWIDGQESHNWQHIEETNTLKFHSDEVPPSGSQIEVSYLGWP